MIEIGQRGEVDRRTALVDAQVRQVLQSTQGFETARQRAPADVQIGQDP
ncbi:hypothetical protein [Streptomyces erythrochromogenes]